jgi:hypothetical protein
MVGRKLVAKKRFDMSHNMGGLQLYKGTYVTVGRERGPYSNILLEQNLKENGFLSIRDMLEYGPLKWKRIHESVCITPIIIEMAEVYMGMLTINARDNEGWLSSALVGHTTGDKLDPITTGEGEILKQAGIRMVADLFSHDGLKGQCHEIFNPPFFSSIDYP